jgi:tetratricopeptide (TPR) repeat protein
MARGAAQARRKAAKTESRRKTPARRRQPTVEQTMFFPRLRRQAKWVFVFLAFVFAAGFVFFGVGSGSGIGSILNGNFNLFGHSSSGASSGVKSALKKTQQHPNDAQAWSDLATAYQTDNKLGKANDARLHYLKLKPKDVDALQQVAQYYEQRYLDKANAARALQSEAPLDFTTVIGISSSQLAQSLGQDQIGTQATQKASSDFADATAALQKDQQYYGRVVKLQPTDPNTQFHLGQIAETLGNNAVALKAFNAVVKLAPKDPLATQAKQQITLLSLQSRAKK